MILIAEGGSTKADWVLLDNDFNVKDRFRTIGLNPYFHSKDDVYEALSKSPKIKSSYQEIEGVYFYGAGCSSAKLNQRILDGLHMVFPNANLLVDHDLLAAAYAAYTGEAEIACIIGTGSNSCYFDGQNLKEKLPALGYILGDEASGSYIGKTLVRDYLYKKLPKILHDDFVDTYGLSKGDIIDRVYNQSDVNVYLADFAKFAGKHKDHEYIRSIIQQGFDEFVKTHVLCFEEANKVKINFVGSIASVFKEDLILVLNRHGLELGEMVARPVDGLIRYHQMYRPKIEQTEKLG